MDVPRESPKVRALQAKILKSPRVRVLLSGQRPDGGFGVHPYQKWTGAHWRLVSLVELGIPSGNKKAVAAANQVLGWLGGKSHLDKIKKIRGLTRRCASQEGNALAVCSRIGMANDPRVVKLAESIIEWQWPDGGWNCDKKPQANHSSFYESLVPLWGLIEYHRATDERKPLHYAVSASELFLRHHLFRSEGTGEVIDKEWLKLHYPLYWHYDVLQALKILSLAGKIKDKRAEEALDIVQGKRGSDGLWRAEGFFWYPLGKKKSNMEVVDWGRKGPNDMITLNALRVLKAANRLD